MAAEKVGGGKCSVVAEGRENKAQSVEFLAKSRQTSRGSPRTEHTSEKPKRGRRARKGYH